MTVLLGNGVVPGVGAGPIVRPMPRPSVPRDEPSVDPTEGAAQFTAAATVVADRLAARAGQASGAASEVLMATATLTRDRGLVALVTKHLGTGTGLCASTVAAIEELSAMFAAAGGLMAERVTDLKDVRDRIVAELTGQPEPGIPTPQTPSVLCADDLAPADTAGLDPSTVVAIATSLGGPTSHTSIIARQLGIPCVVGTDGLDDIAVGTMVLVDGAAGEIVLDPTAELIADRLDAATAAGAAAAAWRSPGRTSDDHPVDVLANVQDGAGARRAAETQVQGVGLFRTELCFLDRDVEPTIDEQADIYREVFEAMGDRKVVIRTLDAGSDKPVSFATIKDEPNPALGVRGMRLGWRDEGLMDRQLDAIAQAAAGAEGPVWVMAPMVATEEEAAWFGGKVHERGLIAGVMIEIPSAALLADRILRHVDFLSIGTNDLSQYAFAADRMAPSLSRLTDPWQPALLALIKIVAAAGLAVDKPVGVCGEAAADPHLACVLVGLGVTSLSAAATAAPLVGATVEAASMAQCQAAADGALAASGPDEARDAVRLALA